MTIVDLGNDTVEKERSRLATASLICSLIICCPLATIIGPILGLIALISLSGKDHMKGKGFALSGIVIGLISTALWIVVGVYGFSWVMNFTRQAGTVTTKLVQSGYDGCFTCFRQNLTASSAVVTDEEIQEFIDELTNRYGTFDSATFNFDQQQQELQPVANEFPLPITLIFETTDVSANCMFEFIPEASGLDYTLKFGCFYIQDAQHGDIVFPKGSYCDPDVPKPEYNFEESDS